MTLPKLRAARVSSRQRYHVSYVSTRLSCSNSNLTDTICAIGAYYKTLPGKDETVGMLHEKLYSYALTLAPTSNMERSLGHVVLLLARCFYLLVVCKTER